MVSIAVTLGSLFAFSVAVKTQTSGNSFLLECGMLYKTPENLTVQDCITVLDQFPSFTSVIIMPFPLDERVTWVTDALDNYTRPLTKFLIVGFGDSVDFDLVTQFKDRDYIMMIDDSGSQARTNLEALKLQGCRTGLVVMYNVENNVSGLFADGLVDYSCYAFYPFKVEGNFYEIDKQAMEIIGNWSREYDVQYIVAAQFFGKGACDWRFPSVMELEQLMMDANEVASGGICFFEPFSGTSDRGETFEGFMVHPEVWSLINVEEGVISEYV